MSAVEEHPFPTHQQDAVLFPVPVLTPGVLTREESGAVVLISQNTGRRWQFIRVLRTCIYGEVLLAIEFTDDAGGKRQYAQSHSAIKKMSLAKIMASQPLPGGGRRQTNEDPMQEVAVMQLLARGGGHTNVLTLTEAIKDATDAFLVTPYCDGGELFDVLSETASETQRGFSEKEARMLFAQLIEGVDYLQRQRVTHRDMSLENLLLHKGRVVVVIDFGMALQIPIGPGGERALFTPQGQCGKKNYMSPEVLQNEAFDGFAVDIWACGIILFIMVTGIPPFHLPSVRDQRFRMIAVDHKLQELLQLWKFNLSPLLVELLQSMLQMEARMRPSVAQIRMHPWVGASTPVVLVTGWPFICSTTKPLLLHKQLC
ncbi:unnamed protein product [Chrysoparadoxa australica]